ncbi:hypothetical protein CC31p095 [Enterobacter phage CC31]|uniref:Uncharacterized protein n=1 Tax=Enterobacter phage CC31 TaxID=709484 RepID=E5DIA6_9CAUD|nr:hypothetical protein CC31p095 [Enterobacter phage CC31]ADB81591.1 hypothetical protein CC31p095 [Enterobacter phage CC31]
MFTSAIAYGIIALSKPKENKMKTLEIVVKNIAQAKAVAQEYKVEITSEKQISEKYYIVLEGTSDALIDFVDEFFLNSSVRPYYINEILES